MAIEKLTQAFTDTTELSRYEVRQIIHDIKNCMGVMLLTVGSLEAEPGYMAGAARTIEALEKTIHKMDCLLEALVKLSEQGHPKKTSASRGSLHRRQKLPAAVG